MPRKPGPGALDACSAGAQSSIPRVAVGIGGKPERMARFEVVPSALGTEARRIAIHAPMVTQLNGALGSASAAAAGAAGHGGASAALGTLGAQLAGTLTQLEASIAGLATATHAAGRRYENTDEGQMR